MANVILVVLGTDPGSELPRVAANFLKDSGTFIVSGLINVKNNTFAPSCW